MSIENKIAVIGYACRYPDADNPDQLWENILARRKAFRHIPEKRLNKNYFSADTASPDYIYTSFAAVLKNYQFDRIKHRISKNNYQTADIAHWLALDVAGEAIKNAGINLTEQVKEKTGVITGNTLTGDQSRANLLRLRWPYVAATISSSLKEQNWNSIDISNLLHVIETNYKKPFPEMEEDSLAGGLSNTIAGRICNYYDFKGGGFTIDGACSSSLLAVAKACEAIVNKDLLIALAGGVDISLDPFELVGFSRAGALAKNDMLVYDKDSNGFWPGEGCGFTVLADYDFAKKNNLNILAVIKGWGISSDGNGGLTRPEINGQSLALKRAYEKAGYRIDTVTYIEGHGTGTQAGDTTELSAITKTLSEQNAEHPVYIGSVKANIGHTKAAAGIAGLIKTILVLKNRRIPAVTGNKKPHAIFQQQKFLQLPSSDIIYTSEKPFRAGVSSMGFGGINTHITLEENNFAQKTSFKSKTTSLLSTFQDTELFLLSEPDLISLKKKLNLLLIKAKQISQAEMTDLSCTLHKQFKPYPFRIAIEAATADKLEQKIVTLLSVIEEKDILNDNDNGVFYSNDERELRIGLLFPGQGNDVLVPNRLLTKRFPFLLPFIPEILKKGSEKDQLIHTDFAQPAVVGTSLVAIKLLEKMGIKPTVALGHSVGELAALCMAGILSESDAVKVAAYRGKIMHESALVKGSMLSIQLNYHNPDLDQIVRHTGVSIACINSPSQIVLSGTNDAVEKALIACKEKEIPYSLLKVENAFHSSLMNDVKSSFINFLSAVKFSEPSGVAYSTVSGRTTDTAQEAISNLQNQLSNPVVFYKAFCEAEAKADVWIDAGSGHTLTNMIKNFSNAKILSLDLSGKTVAGIARISGLLFVNDYSFKPDLFFENRFYRQHTLEEEMSFIESPCEQTETFYYEKNNVQQPYNIEEVVIISSGINTSDTESLFKASLAKKLGLSGGSFKNSDRMLNDLHLNSLFVAQFIAEFSEQHNLKSTDTPLEYANASIDEIIEMYQLCNDAKNANDSKNKQVNENAGPEGIGAWVHFFDLEYVERPLENEEQDLSSALNDYTVCGKIPLSLTGAAGCNPQGNAKKMLVFLPVNDETEIIKILLSCSQSLKNNSGIDSVLFVQIEPVSNGFAKSLFLEEPEKNISVLTIADEDITTEIIYTELKRVNGFTEVTYGNGKRYVPGLTPVKLSSKDDSVLPGHTDIILVTGGAKGITLECVRKLGQLTKCKFILLGKSEIEKDETLINNLHSLTQSGVAFDYYSCDISSKKDISSVLDSISKKNETITGIIHAAGINKPKRIYDLQVNDFNATLKPKVTGLQNLLCLISMDKVKFCISFGSVIAKTGMEGNADYALANQWMENEMNKGRALYRHTNFLNIEWSVWGGTGMGQSLGVLEILKSKGIEPVSLDNGIRVFINMLKHPPAATNIIASGRYGKLSTLHHHHAETNIAYRFIENISVHYPGIELIAECSLSEHTDHYLRDHIVEGKMLFPAAFGIEAMMQAVRFLTKDPAVFFEIKQSEFLHPIMIENNTIKKIRIIVQWKNENTFQAVIRDEATKFKKDHFRAAIVLKKTEKIRKEKIAAIPVLNYFDTDKDLYSSLLFHKGVFQRVASYFKIEPYKCIASASRLKEAKYFSDFLPQSLLSGDPALNDAALHAVQVCVPDKVLLPVQAGSVSFYSVAKPDDIIITATEKEYRLNEYIYDIIVSDKKGFVLQKWISVVFRAMNRITQPTLPLCLTEVVLQRKVDQLTGKRQQPAVYLNRQYYKEKIIKRTDGKPLLNTGVSVSKSRMGSTTLYAEAEKEIACDMEAVVQQPDSIWHAVLGDEKMQLVSNTQQETGEDFSSAATRVLCTAECMRKAGLQFNSPVVFDHAEKDGTVYFKSGNYKMITYKCTIKQKEVPVIFSFLLKQNYEEDF